MRHPRTQQCIAITFICLSVTWAYADGWGTNFWPSQMYPRKFKDQLSDFYNATASRCSAAEAAGPKSPEWYRSNMVIITNLKERLQAVIPLYIDTDRAISGGYTNYSDYFTSIDTNARYIPTWSVTSILAACMMPTNWFEYTPRRGLSGLGWETNDSSVGYPHGETNGYTIAGGTNFPSSRTSKIWYSTDYGLSAATGIFSRLIHFGVSHTVSYPTDLLMSGTRTYYRWRDYATAELDLPSVLSDLPGPYRIFAYGNYWESIPATGGFDYAHESTSKWRIQRNTYSGAGYSVDYYMNVSPYENLAPGGPVAHTQAFVYSGSPLSSFTNYYVMQKVKSWDRGAGTAKLVTEFLGGTDSTVTKYGLAPNLNEKPTEPYISTKGWQFLDTHYLIIKYDFSYK